ncbi:hypothetical protein EJB05_37107, partial [Eragrostis curvula]
MDVTAFVRRQARHCVRETAGTRHQALVCANVGVSEVWGKHRFLDGEPRPMQAVMKSNGDAATHRDLDGHPFVDAVLVVEVDAVNAETLEAALACRAYVRRVAADLALAVGEGEAELGGQLHLLPHPALQSLHMGITWSIFSANDLVGVGAVDVGGVEEGDAGGDGVVDERDHVRLGLGRAVEGGHSHAAEALRRDLQTLRAKLHARHGHRSCCHGREGQNNKGHGLVICIGEGCELGATRLKTPQKSEQQREGCGRNNWLRIPSGLLLGAVCSTDTALPAPAPATRATVASPCSLMHPDASNTFTVNTMLPSYRNTRKSPAASALAFTNSAHSPAKEAPSPLPPSSPPRTTSTCQNFPLVLVRVARRPCSCA